MESIKLRASIGFGNLGYYYCQCQGSAFCRINHEGEYYPKPEADAKISRLEDEVERLRELLGNTTERLNLIMIDLLGFAGAALSESNRIFLKSLFNFLEDSSGLSEKIIAEELKRKGVDVDKLLKRTDDLIRNMRAKQALSVGRRT